jgi:hypothetical protein
LISNEPMDMAKIRCEQHLMLLGWKRPEGAHPQPFNKSDRGRQRREERKRIHALKSRGIAHVDP